MLIKKEIFTPAILTIPDDTAIFSILDMNEKITHKIIMENFIDFCCFKDNHIMLFRFRNSMNFENIKGLDQCFIPIEIIQKYHNNLDILIHLIMEDYAILMPVCRNCIDFYGNDAVGTHLAFIYGVDTSKQTFFCKDFYGKYFTTFETSFESIKKSLLNYYSIYTQKSDGLIAFRSSKTVCPNIEYSNVFCEFHKLWQEFATDTVGHGLKAIDLYLNNIRDYNDILSWYVIANYMRESIKLMNIRYNILKEEINKRKMIETYDGKAIIEKACHDTDILFFKIYKLHCKNTIITNEITNNLTELTYICKEDFKLIAEYFCKTITNFYSPIF